MPTAITLSPDQTSAIQGYISASDYPGGYNYAKSIVSDAIAAHPAADNTDLENLANWLDNAAHINANDGSFKSEFVRGATEAFSDLTGKALADSRFQAGSDQLGLNVLSSMVTSASIPDSGTIIGTDVAAAVSAFDLPPFAWAGTLFDFLPASVGGG